MKYTDQERLEYLIGWLGLNDTLERSGIRDWGDYKDARNAIDEAIDTARQDAATEL